MNSLNANSYYDIILFSLFEETQYRPDITYFYKLQGVCGEAKSEESGARSFTMLPRGQIKNFKCNEGDGTEPGGFETIANQKLLERDLVVGDTFTYAGYCKIAVKSVEKVGGYYKGKGVYRFPMAMFGFPLINIQEQLKNHRHWTDFKY